MEIGPKSTNLTIPTCNEGPRSKGRMYSGQTCAFMGKGLEHPLALKMVTN